MPTKQLRRRLWSLLVTIAVGAGLIVVVAAAPASAQAGSYFLAPGQSLGVGQYIKFETEGLVLQYDGNLVLYNHFQGDGGTQVACWASNTTSHPGPYLRQAIMQQDGNFVLYLYPGGPVEWASGTNSPEHYGDNLYLSTYGLFGGTISYYTLNLGPLPASEDRTILNYCRR